MPGCCVALAKAKNFEHSITLGSYKTKVFLFNYSAMILQYSSKQDLGAKQKRKKVSSFSYLC